MKGIGTIVNVLAIVAGGGFGLLLKGKVPVRIQRLFVQFTGIIALFLGARSLLGSWFMKGVPGKEVSGTMLVIFSLFLGGLLGEAFRLDRLLDKLGGAICRMDKQAGPVPGTSGKAMSAADKRKASVRRAREAQPAGTNDAAYDDGALPLSETRTGNRFIDGFAIATVLCGFSCLSFPGAITEGLTGDTKELFIKAAIDAVMILLLASVYGIGAGLGSAAVWMVQGAMTFIATQWSDKMTPTLIAHLTIIASVMTLGIGINLCFGKRLRVINLAPALLISPLYSVIIKYIDKLIDK